MAMFLLIGLYKYFALQEKGERFGGQGFFNKNQGVKFVKFY